MLGRAIGVHVVAAVAATLLHVGWLILVFRWSGVFDGMTGTMGEMFRILALSRFYLDLLTYFAILGGAYAFDYHDRLGERELRASRLETQLARARLDALRMQLNPHFLFNALHAVTAQVRAGRGPAAVTMLGGLGDLLRYALDTDGEPLVPLWRELAFLDRYLDIERVRFADRLRVEVNVPAELREGWVPPLLLQPLVENAVRHGIAPREGPGRIEVAAERMDDRLALTVRDDGVGLGAGSVPGTGVGLANARARLAELYGDGWELEVADRAGGGVEVRVTIPWRPRPR
jgi:LytS/YehU family sensor histidine kinase